MADGKKNMSNGSDESEGSEVSHDFEELEAKEETLENEENQVFSTQYDVTSKERYVDSTSHKTEFEKVLDELAGLSKETLEWNVLRWTKKHFDETDQQKDRKLEAYLGAFILNAAMELYDRGLAEAAFQKLEQAKSVLEAKRKLTQEVESIKSKNEDLFDISELIGFFESGESS